MHTLHVDVRVIAATNRNLEKWWRLERFWRDLFSTGFNVFPIYLPPLRERLEDLPSLADHFAAGKPATSAERKRPPPLSLAAMDMLPALINGRATSVRASKRKWRAPSSCLAREMWFSPRTCLKRCGDVGQTHQGSAENHWQAGRQSSEK